MMFCNYVLGKEQGCIEYEKCLLISKILIQSKHVGFLSAQLPRNTSLYNKEFRRRELTPSYLMACYSLHVQKYKNIKFGQLYKILKVKMKHPNLKKNPNQKRIKSSQQQLAIKLPPNNTRRKKSMNEYLYKISSGYAISVMLAIKICSYDSEC